MLDASFLESSRRIPPRSAHSSDEVPVAAGRTGLGWEGGSSSGRQPRSRAEDRARGRRRHRPRGDRALRGSRGNRGLHPFRPRLELFCRRAFVGAGVWGGRSVRFGGGGHRDLWAVLAGRRPRVRRRRGVRQRLPAGPHRPRGLPHDAVVDRDAHNIGHLSSRGSRTASRRSCSRTGRRSGSGRSSTPAAGSAPRRSSRRARTSRVTSPRARSRSVCPRR